MMAFIHSMPAVGYNILVVEKGRILQSAMASLMSSAWMMPFTKERDPLGKDCLETEPGKEFTATMVPCG